MNVVATGVHPVRYARGKRQSGSLLTGERVHFGAERDGSARAGSLEPSHDAATLPGVVVRNPKSLELLPDLLSGTNLFVGELGVLMEMAPEGDQVGEQCVQRLFDGHVYYCLRFLGALLAVSRTQDTRGQGIEENPPGGTAPPLPGSRR